MLLIPPLARATFGGPELADFLGWDPAEKKVFSVVQSIDESGNAARVFYWVLGDSTFRSWQLVAWSRSEEGDTTHALRLRRLKARLRPLEPMLMPTMLSSRILSVDTLRGPYDDRRVRYHVLAGNLQTIGGMLNVTTIQDPEVRVIRQYRVPGRDETLGIVSFLGIPWEIGYEAQVPVVLPKMGDTLRVVWKPLR